MVITQADVYKYTLYPATKEIPHGVIIPCLTEYLRSLYRHSLQAEDYLNELLVDLLISEKRHYELHQHLQYHILNDSLPIAQRLLILSSDYAPAYQLGLDMFYRLNAFPILLKALLEQKEIIEALRLVSPKSHLFEDRHLLPREFLRVAESTKNDQVFYSAFKFFEERNLLLRNDRKFEPSDGCDEYVKAFEKLFGNRDRKDQFYQYDDEDKYIESDDDENDQIIGGIKDEDKVPTISPTPKSVGSGAESPTPLLGSETGSGKPRQGSVGGTGETVTIPEDLTEEDGNDRDSAVQ